MRSTRYMTNDMVVDEVKMVGQKAVINTTESQPKMVGLSDINSVLTSKQSKKKGRQSTMKDSNS